jgi:hypothetical protein
MYCPNCGFKNSDGMRFCGNCGNELPAVLPGKGPLKCAKCGAELRPGVKFCGTCGAEVAVPPTTQAATPIALPTPVPAPSSAQATADKKKARDKKIGIKGYLVRFLVWMVVGVLAVVAWNLLQPQRDALLTVFGRNPKAAEAAAQVFINENIPDLSYAERTVTFSMVDGVPVYVVDFFDNNAEIPYGARLLVDRITLEVQVYQTANMVEVQSTTTDASQVETTMTPSAQVSSPFELPATADQLLTNPQVDLSYDLSTLPTDGMLAWNYVGLAPGQAGLLELPSNDPSNTYIVFSPIAEAHGAVIRFKLADAPNSFQAFLAKGELNTDSYLRFGVTLGQGGTFEPSAWKGTENRSDLVSNTNMEGSLAVTTDQWYGLFVGSDSSGNLRVYIWDWENPAQYVWNSLHRGITWDDHNWSLVIHVDSGTVFLDDYAVVSFDGFK